MEALLDPDPWDSDKVLDVLRHCLTSHQDSKLHQLESWEYPTPVKKRSEMIGRKLFTG
jgi:hypothetical protein